MKLQLPFVYSGVERKLLQKFYTWVAKSSMLYVIWTPGRLKMKLQGIYCNEMRAGGK